MFILQALLTYITFYVTFQQHFPSYDWAPAGVNLTNLLVVMALLLMGALGVKAATPAPLKRRFLFFFVILTVSFLIGQIYDSSTTLDDLRALKDSIFYILLYFLFYHAAADVKMIRLLLIVILAVATLASIDMLREALTYGIGAYKENHRVAGPFGPWNYRQANRAATYLVMYIPIFASIFLLFKTHIAARSVALGCLLLTVMAVFFTGSRQAYGIVAALTVLVAMRRGILAGSFVLILLFYYEAWIPESALQRIQMTEQVDENGEEQLDESTESRFVQWAGAMDLMSTRPWGIGLNHFKREIGSASGYSNLDAHNFYVLLSTEAGIQGLLALVAVLLGLFGLAWRVRRQDESEEARIISFGYMMAVLGMMLGNVFGSRFFDGDVMGNFWILTALVARYATLREEEAAHMIPALPTDSHRHLANRRLGEEPVRG
jgi:O-antigen ligase